MDKKSIQERIDKLLSEREQLKSAFAVYEGAIQEANYWLAQVAETTEE